MDEEVKAGGGLSAQLRVSHPADDSRMGRGLKLSLDGEELTRIKAGQSVTLNIEAGPHELRADNTYQSKSVEFDAKPGEQVHYRIRNRVGSFGWFLLWTLGAGPIYVVFERVEPVESSAIPLPRAEPS